MNFRDCVRGSVTLCDGAWGTELQKHHLPLGASADEWNLTRPDIVQSTAESYVQAGSRIILTNTFRSNPISLAPYGLEGQCTAINRAGVKLSRSAAGRLALVFASIGPSGKKLSVNEVTPVSLKEAFTRQAQSLAEEGPDALLIETMIDLTEARIAADAALETGLPVIVSFAFTSGEDGDRTLTGTTPEQAAAILTGAGISAIGANCGFGIRHHISICKRLAAATSLPLWIKPNAGLPETVNGLATYKITPAEFASAAKELIAAGPTFLGGCCGTSPEFIRVLAQDPAFAGSSTRDSGKPGYTAP
jgi:5-methyltetrahydrofolate--homocysteine methyltransferase